MKRHIALSAAIILGTGLALPTVTACSSPMSEETEQTEQDGEDESGETSESEDSD